jgi:uncharacterized protein YggE
MSTIEEPYDGSTRNMKKLAFFTALMALGVSMAAALFAGSQMLNAHAQISSSENSPLAQNTSFLKGPSLSANLSTVSTSGTATTKVTPDMFSVIVGVETNGTTAQEAVSRNANLTAQVVAALRGLGIRENQIGTSSYSLSPIYEDSRQPIQAPPCIEIYPPPPECEPRQNIIGYSASNSVTVTLSVNAGIDAGQVIDASVQAGANNVNGLYFFVSPDRQQEIRDILVRDAIASARQRANIAAEALGMTVSQVQSVDLNEVFFPIFRGGLEEVSTAGAADNVSLPTQILPGEQEVSTTVSIVFYMSNGSSEED